MFDNWRRHLTELVVVFVGVALAFAVENLREDLNDQAVGEQYLQDFRADLLADRELLQAHLEWRRNQGDAARVVLEYFEGQDNGPQRFFESYYFALQSRNFSPNRNTMDEVLSSGSLRFIRDSDIRHRLLNLYVTYGEIRDTEVHMARDFDIYLYDPTFSSIRIQLEGPWEDSETNRDAVAALVDDVRIENGLRLLVGNLEFPEDGLISLLELALVQIEELLGLVSGD